MGFFAEKGFQAAIEEFAKDLGWEISELNETEAAVDLNEEQSLFIDFNEDTLVFSIPSAAWFESKDDIAHEDSTFLLERNAEIKFGFWGLVEMEEGWGYVLYYDQFLPHKDINLDLNSQVIEEIIEGMLAEVDEFNAWWEGVEEE
jgi:hypothetical protein